MIDLKTPQQIGWINIMEDPELLKHVPEDRWPKYMASTWETYFKGWLLAHRKEGHALPTNLRIVTRIYGDPPEGPTVMRTEPEDMPIPEPSPEEVEEFMAARATNRPDPATCPHRFAQAFVTVTPSGDVDKVEARCTACGKLLDVPFEVLP